MTRRQLPVFGDDANASAMASLSTGQYMSQVQTQIQNLPNQAKQYGTNFIAQQTGLPVGNQQTAQGAAAAIDLAQNGFDPSNEADDAKLIHAISGGLALIVPVGTIVAGALETLWLGYTTLACPAEQFFASIGASTLPPECGGKTCVSSGNWSSAGIIADNRSQLPSYKKGSFAELVIGALAYYKAQQANCKAGLPVGVIVDAVVNIWNKTHQGPPVEYLIPPLSTNVGIIIPAWQSMSGTANFPSMKAGKDPWVYYAFGPASLAAREAGNNVLNQSTVARSFPIGSQPDIFGQLDYVPARLVLVNTGALIVPEQTVPFNIGQPAYMSMAVANLARATGAAQLAVAATPPKKPLGVLYAAPIVPKKMNVGIYMSAGIASGAGIGFLFGGPVGAIAGGILGGFGGWRAYQ